MLEWEKIFLLVRLEEAANGDEKVNIDSAEASGSSCQRGWWMLGEELDAIHISDKRPVWMRSLNTPIRESRWDDQCSHSHVPQK